MTDIFLVYVKNGRDKIHEKNKRIPLVAPQRQPWKRFSDLNRNRNENRINLERKQFQISIKMKWPRPNENNKWQRTITVAPTNNQQNKEQKNGIAAT